MENYTVFDVLVKGIKESFAVWILVFCSILSLGVIIERFWNLFIKSRGLTPRELARKIIQAVIDGKKTNAIALCDSIDSPYARVFKLVLEENNDEKVSMAVEEEVLQMEKNLGILGTIGNIAPYIGLFGTVIGVMKAFQSLGVTGATGPTVVMKGISEALIATAIGLFVAVVAVVFYNYFLRKVKRNTKEISILSSEIADVISDVLKRKK